MLMSLSAADLAERLGTTLRGQGSTPLTGCATLDAAEPEHVSFLANPRYAPQLRTTRAGAVILSERDAEQADDRTVLIADNPYFAFREAMVLLHGFRPQAEAGVSPQASIDPTATVPDSCTVHPFAFIGPRAVLGERCVLYSGCSIGADARIGDDCQLYPNVTVYDRCVLGSRVTLHAGCVIGQDGFGYATHARETGEPPRHHKIPQAGIAIVEDDVEMGANCSVDRATLGATVVGQGTKFSNSVTIGHGTRVGPHNLYVAQVGLAGSVETGAYVVMGGQVGVAGHLQIGDAVQIAATSGVMHDVPSKTQVGGAPAIPFADMKRIFIHQQRLPDLAATVKKLQRKVEQLEKRLASADGGDA